ncbi:Mini-ribonuclease 3 [Murimonas intestini]|uniref:Mini-ribonuclease 3 n=1 Tax=Murimonas intestini TaxID=1337051 RepID=A0AB73T1J6_9FIRM|nr:ribonuclease III domain-containing protein [Murimonas intestini]MCR1842433.1 ribonuclease III [Murimonas intestini]MCR1867209.1 ribonuclease III [Murimonas intestini]MCR1884395.1 ribonuclease III [Murimonas intestini]
MEKGIESLAAYLKEEFQMGEVDIRTYSPLTLAYIGDAVYDLIIRTLVVERGNCPPHKLHKRTSQIVKAPAQAEMIERILPLLGGEEEQIYKRGRNAKSFSTAKNASVLEYRKATGLEALMGFLYLRGDMGRIVELVKAGLDKGEEG